MSSINLAGFKDIPPVSKQTPLPTKAKGFFCFLFPFHSIVTMYVTMEWNGNKKQKKPLAFVGKGVCFDTGGISLKPARFMEDMTYDMAGSAVVVGLLKSLALRKAKVKAVGVVGLVENMVSGNAQRPGDIV